MVLPNTRYAQCSGDDSSPSNVSNTTCMVEWNHIQTCHPDRNEMEWRDLPKLQILPCVGYFCNLRRFLHSADAAVGMTISERSYEFAYCSYNMKRCPAGASSVSPTGRASFPTGEAFVPCRGAQRLNLTSFFPGDVTNRTRAVEWNHAM